MLDDLIVQLFDQQPRTEISVYMLLTGKKTQSVLFAALQHDQLKWLQLYPTLSRSDYQAAIKRLEQAQVLKRDGNNLSLRNLDAQQAAAKRLALPAHYAPWMDLAPFWLKLQLAIQSLSEYTYHNRFYRPVTPDWPSQQAVRQWWVAIKPAAAIQELTALFAALPQAQSDLLSQQLIGHDYVGAGGDDSLAGHMQRLDALAQLVVALDANRLGSWARLWGGRKPLGTQSQYQALALAQAGMPRPQIAQRLRLKPSTVNEHLLGAALFGAKLPLDTLYSPAMMAAFGALPKQRFNDFHELLAQVPGSDFFLVRLYEILVIQGRWPDGSGE
ncbi:helix-turn-helix domain-containing protein [Lacticaseibacillus jixiensis]|uniref:helix-turn-helix domain-containing protein n=1 Tax=Lacticaseibacillus jixiensis TaxID=3231926 RepID=UPI0036F31167